jgi:hypothetical protein
MKQQYAANGMRPASLPALAMSVTHCFLALPRCLSNPDIDPSAYQHGSLKMDARRLINPTHYCVDNGYRPQPAFVPSQLVPALPVKAPAVAEAASSTFITRRLSQRPSGEFCLGLYVWDAAAISSGGVRDSLGGVVFDSVHSEALLVHS